MEQQTNINAEGFLNSLSVGKDVFPRRLLKALRQYLGYNRSIFMPCLNESIYRESNARWAAINNYVGFNFSIKELQDYSRLAKYDFFAPAKLPVELRSRAFITVEDIMSYDQYEKTAYYRFVQQAGLYYQASFMLKDPSGRILACIGLFRTKAEGPFTKGDSAILTGLGEYISTLYIAEVKQTKSVAVYTMLDLFFGYATIGTLMTDNRGMILWSNQAARELGQELTRTGADTILNNIAAFDEETMEIQQVIMDMREFLLIGNPTQYTPHLKQKYTFHSVPISTKNIMGTSESRHLIFICRSDLAADYSSVINTLTRRERQILDGMLNGMSNDAISQQFHISTNTVRTHISNIYRKLNVKNKSDIFIKLKGL